MRFANGNSRLMEVSCKSVEVLK